MQLKLKTDFDSFVGRTMSFNHFPNFVHWTPGTSTNAFQAGMRMKEGSLLYSTQGRSICHVVAFYVKRHYHVVKKISSTWKWNAK